MRGYPYTGEFVGGPFDGRQEPLNELPDAVLVGIMGRDFLVVPINKVTEFPPSFVRYRLEDTREEDWTGVYTFGELTPTGPAEQITEELTPV